MDNTDYQHNITVQYCFPNNNASCRKEVRTGPGYLLLYIILSCVSVCTVLFNLLVIISISHFKQLHTPTNMLILSLAVADLLVGLFVMPLKTMQLFDSCWYLGKLACSISEIITGLLVLASLYNLVFIAVDRYVAITDPMFYSRTITVYKMSVCIFLGWTFCLLYVIIFMYFNDHLTPSQMYTRCYGECIVFVQFSWVIANMLFFFLVPCSIIIILYSLIFKVARHQAKAVRAVRNGASNNNGPKVSSSSETKAAKTLGIVISFFFAFWIPFYISSLSVKSLTTLSMVWTVFTWLMFSNSFVNPLIYAIFYPWFRESVKCILTCKIFESSSSMFNLYRDHS
ncbi:trace amine-associated receptor 6-like [Colossoma macropomum]|uniref:trace amine-associated receptor 6-like n=1 Tax=Colossoma macropomum TaxID=42526 RepID=UPI0018642A06|nr:trace amine-associated receptor 6-like [Colossoma macropomum]